MKSVAVRIWLSILLIALAAYGIYSGWRMYDRFAAERSPAVAVTPVQDALVGHRIQPFHLTERSGREFDSDELDGQVWVASFFFSSCPGACIKMNNTIARLQEEYRNSNIKFVSITVDPENDTLEELQKYARHFGADDERWLFLTGPETEIRRVCTEDFKLAYGRALHSDRLVVIDRAGAVQGAYRATEDAQMVLMKRKLEQLLKG
jgi:cytochrome oxidase Cu insertion factor (SCO1/SenC/PrrC family)